jgi:hypothetical protein
MLVGDLLWITLAGVKIVCVVVVVIKEKGGLNGTDSSGNA